VPERDDRRDARNGRRRAGAAVDRRHDRADRRRRHRQPASVAAEFDALARLLGRPRLAVPIYACTGRHVLAGSTGYGRRKALEAPASTSSPTPAWW
jgi:hypothetical protein